jgi:hypothetical protein
MSVAFPYRCDFCGEVNYSDTKNGKCFNCGEPFPDELGGGPRKMTHLEAAEAMQGFFSGFDPEEDGNEAIRAEIHTPSGGVHTIYNGVPPVDDDFVSYDVDDPKGYPVWRTLKTEEPQSDPVDHPDHYKVLPIETIDAIKLYLDALPAHITKFQAHCIGNVLKYRLRAGHKGGEAKIIEDIGKAMRYENIYRDNPGPVEED